MEKISTNTTRKDPCDRCKHSKFEMVDQFTYRTWCAKGAKDGVFESPWGCYKFKKRKR